MPPQHQHPGPSDASAHVHSHSHTVNSVGVEVIDMSDDEENPQTIWYNYAPAAASAASSTTDFSHQSQQHVSSSDSSAQSEQPSHDQLSDVQVPSHTYPMTNASSYSTAADWQRPHQLTASSSSNVSSDEDSEDDIVDADHDMTDPTVLLEYLRETIHRQQSASPPVGNSNMQPTASQSTEQDPPSTCNFRAANSDRREAVPEHLHHRVGPHSGKTWTERKATGNQSAGCRSINCQREGPHSHWHVNEDTDAQFVKHQ